MRNEALDIFVCPVCRSRLYCRENTERCGAHIVRATLRCSGCGHPYPVSDGVPRLLPPASGRADLATGDAYAGYFRHLAPGGPKAAGELYGKTVAAEIDDLLEKCGLADLAALEGAHFLDAGCGLGRIDGALAERCRTVVALDITPSVVEVARAWKDCPNVHVVQGDLTALPLGDGRFDFVWCDGGLAYVSDLGVALGELGRVRSPGASLYSWVYEPARRAHERIGRLFHRTGLPIPLRFLCIRVLSTPLLWTASLWKGSHLRKRSRAFAESALDWSLAAHINRLSEAEARALTSALGIDATVRTRKGRVEFASGLVRAAAIRAQAARVE